MLQNDMWVPLFPLKAVLFPGGIMPLKIFETRYIEMVRECMKHNAPFGIALIKSGQEAGAGPEAIGCLAHVSQWEMPEPGVMKLRIEGGERFRILETRVLSDNRLEARVQFTRPISFPGYTYDYEFDYTAQSTSFLSK